MSAAETQRTANIDAETLERRTLRRQMTAVVVVASPPGWAAVLLMAFLMPRTFERVEQALERWVVCEPPRSERR